MVNRRVAAASAFGTAIHQSGTPGKDLGSRVLAIPRMIRMAWRGEYPLLGKGKLLTMGAALAYVVSPVDLIPEGLLLVFGLIDDALVGTFLAGSLLSETGRFLEWEQQHVPATTKPAVIQGEVVR